jgi:hypothetical protein
VSHLQENQLTTAVIHRLDCVKLYVGNLPYRVTEADIYNAFEQHPPEHVKICTDAQGVLAAPATPIQEVLAVWYVTWQSVVLINPSHLALGRVFEDAVLNCQ